MSKLMSQHVSKHIHLKLLVLLVKLLPIEFTMGGLALWWGLGDVVLDHTFGLMWSWLWGLGLVPLLVCFKRRLILDQIL